MECDLQITHKERKYSAEVDGQGFLNRKSLTHEKCEIEENNVLTNLPVGVLELITKNLSINDYLALRTTCHSCRKTISNAIENKHCCHLPEMPQVFLQIRNSRFFFSLSKKSLHHHLAISAFKKLTKCFGSINGWLIMNDYSETGFVKCFFLNPVTNVRITIPSKLSLPTPSDEDDIIPLRKMVASSTPNCDGSNSDCYLVGLFSNYRRIAIYKLFDKSWTIFELDKDSGFEFDDVEIIGTNLYVSDSKGSISIYCLKDFINGPPKAKVLPNIIVSSCSTIGSTNRFGFLGKDEARRELYFISLFTVFGDVEPPRVTKFEVFKLETNKDPIEWKNVQLEDKVAFVSTTNSMVMSRDEVNFNKDLIKGNSIYFAFNFPCPKNSWSGLKLGMFSFTDSSIKYFPLETSKHGAHRPVWFVPSFW